MIVLSAHVMIVMLSAKDGTKLSMNTSSSGLLMREPETMLMGTENFVDFLLEPKL